MSRHDFQKALTGVSGILVAPFDREDEFNPKKLEPIIDRAINAGTHSLVANGNTGEFYGLTIEEAENFVISAAEWIADRVPLTAGVGRSVRDACHLARASVTAGAKGLMVHQPPDPFVSPRGYVEYVKRVSGASNGLPLILYLRNDQIGLDAISELCAIENVVGVKWATPNPTILAKAIESCPDHIIWVGGLAELWAPPFYAVGARGFTSGLINVWPERSVAIHNALEFGDYPLSNTLVAGMSPFEEIRAEEMNGSNVTVVKAALAMMGNDCGPTRPPSAWPLTSQQSSLLHNFLVQQGLVPSTV
ncbi:MAG: dihydrodipicolinate synthase family protein [Pseudomonadota bacterium]